MENTANTEKFRIAEITERKCSDKVQPDVKVGNRYFMVGTDQTKDGTQVILLANLQKSKGKKTKVTRCNAQRFGWKIYTQEEIQEQAFKKRVHDDYEEILHGFTFQEHMQIAFLPLIICHCAWIYAFRAIKKGADFRIQELKKLKRAVEELRKSYNDEQGKDLDFRHKKQIEEQCQKFMDAHANDFTIMEFTVRNELLKVAPEDPYSEMKMEAFIAKVLCSFYVHYNEQCDEIIQGRLGKRQGKTLPNPKITALQTCMDAYMGKTALQVTKDIELCIQIFAKNLKSVEFDTDHEERIKKGA